MIIKRLKNNKALFTRFTGLTPIQFQKLLFKLKPIYQQNEAKRLSKRTPKRKRAIGGGVKFKLTLEDRLLMLLLYYRTYMTHEFLGLLFGLHNSNVSRAIRHINPLLSKIFKIPEKRINLTEKEIKEIKYFLIDGTEQPIQRPKNHKNKKQYYSGKKKDIQ